MNKDIEICIAVKSILIFYELFSTTDRKGLLNTSNKNVCRMNIFQYKHQHYFWKGTCSYIAYRSKAHKALNCCIVVI